MYEDLIVSAMPLARRLANSYRGGLDSDEAISVAYYALTRAASRFDKSLGVTFSNYAAPCIVGALKEAMRKTSQVGNFRTVGEVETVSLDAGENPLQIGAYDRHEPAIARIDLRRMTEALRRRGPRRYLVAKMFAAGWSDGRIRETLGMSEGLLANTKHQVLQIIRQELPTLSRRSKSEFREAARAHVLPESTVRSRLSKGAPVDKAFRQPGYELDGVSLSIEIWAALHGLKADTVRRRLRVSGMTLREALSVPLCSGGWGISRKRMGRPRIRKRRIAAA